MSSVGKLQDSKCRREYNGEVLGLFFLLVWISVIAALTGAERRRGRRLLLPGQVDEEFRAALSRNDHAELVRYYRVVLQRKPPLRDEQLIRINLACALNGMKQFEQALDELDQVALKHLHPTQVALWLNNRAYTLTLLGRPDDALDNLTDAQELLIGEDGLSRDPGLLACIAGTRGIALYHKGRLDEAEAALHLALKLEDDGTVLQFDPDSEVSPARTAERWWWLSQVARKRGEETEARERLLRAARHPLTEYGGKAAEALRESSTRP